MTHTIKFNSPLKGLIPEPKPAINYIPDAFKNHKAYGEGTVSVKKCVPFLDAMLTGYIIPTPVDYAFSYNSKEQRVSFDMNPNIPEELTRHFNIAGHTDFQFQEGLRPSFRTIDTVFKFMNTWHIETPKNYSCIFTNPLNRNLPYKIIDGVVDTDTYFTSINFPFFWTGPIDREVIIKTGSPMCLIVPFKRDNWKMKVNLKEEKTKDRMNFFRHMYDNYKNKVWSKKSYK